MAEQDSASDARLPWLSGDRGGLPLLSNRGPLDGIVVSETKLHHWMIKGCMRATVGPAPSHADDAPACCPRRKDAAGNDANSPSVKCYPAMFYRSSAEGSLTLR